MSSDVYLDRAVDRFFEKVVEFGEPCWDWTGAQSRFGHGLTSFRETRIGAHRFAYAVANGIDPLELDPDLVVRHKCDRPSCVNPAHLELGTHSENVRDSIERRRHPVAFVDGKCRNGHDITAEGSIYGRPGKRGCAECRRIARSAWRSLPETKGKRRFEYATRNADPEYRAKKNAQDRIRRADPEYRARVRARERELYARRRAHTLATRALEALPLAIGPAPVAAVHEHRVAA